MNTRFHGNRPAWSSSQQNPLLTEQKTEKHTQEKDTGWDFLQWSVCCQVISFSTISAEKVITKYTLQQLSEQGKVKDAQNLQFSLKIFSFDHHIYLISLGAFVCVCLTVCVCVCVCVCLNPCCHDSGCCSWVDSDIDFQRWQLEVSILDDTGLTNTARCVCVCTCDRCCQFSMPAVEQCSSVCVCCTMYWKCILISTCAKYTSQKTAWTAVDVVPCVVHSRSECQYVWPIRWIPAALDNKLKIFRSLTGFRSINHCRKKKIERVRGLSGAVHGSLGVCPRL